MIKEIGKYFMFLGNLFTNRETFKTYYKLVLEECISIGLGSLFFGGAGIYVHGSSNYSTDCL